MYRFVEQVDPKEHDAFIAAHPLCNLLQTSDWAKVKDNWDHAIVGVRAGEQLVASALVLIKQLPLHFTMMYVPRGPVMDYHNKELTVVFLQGLQRWAKRYHCLFIKMDPGIHYRDYLIEEQETAEVHTGMKEILENLRAAGAIHQGFTTYIKESIQPRYQANVYACEDFDASLPRHTRRLIKDALKRNVEAVRVGEERLDEFADVVALTEKRKHVSLRNREYFHQLMEIYQEDCYLFLAEVDVRVMLEGLYEQRRENDAQLAQLKEGAPKKKRRLEDIHRSLARDIAEFEEIVREYPQRTVIAGVLSIKVGDTLEMLYAGMNERFKKFMPQYYLYTEIMKYAFANGCRYANMGGVEGDLQDGLTKFKANFHPHINEFIGEFDLPVNRVLYHASQKAYAIRKNRMLKRNHKETDQ
ncbi:MAG TPA: aminoacyltransferase [Candidatus Merdibacter merdigallinarum]|nr:aminoacyltransferase [Candidatus Merdibacter merdigallinarum]